MENRLALASAVVLLGVSTALGIAGQPTEMGIAVVAGGLGLTFANLNRIRRFRGGGIDLETREQIEAVLEKETETEIEPLGSTETPPINGERRAVLSALANPKFTWRSVEGLAKEVKLERLVVEEALAELSKRQLARRSVAKRRTIWSLTRRGRQVQATLSVE